MDKCFNLNAWIEADSTLKYLLEDKWFPNYKLRNLGAGTYGFYSGADLVFYIETGGVSLSEPGAQWIMSWKGDSRTSEWEVAYPYGLSPRASSFRLGNQELHIDFVDTAADKSWHVTIVDSDSSMSYLDLNVTLKSRLVPQSLMETDFTVTGSGKYHFLEGCWWQEGVAYYTHLTFLSFDIKKPMQFVFSYDGLCWHGGQMEMLAQNNDETLPVSADFKGPYNVEIIYKNKSQMWNVYSGHVIE